MTSHSIDLTFTVTLEAPLHIGTGYGHAGYLDAVMTTDAHGYPYIPGSSLKGRLRYYLEHLLPVLAPEQTAEKITTAIFGSKKETGSLYFDNCPLTQKWADLIDAVLPEREKAILPHNRPAVMSQRQANVMLSRLRVVALERRLFTVESAPSHLAFTGCIHGQLDGDDLVGGYPRTLCLLVAAIHACTHLGGRKSRGLGRCRLKIDSLLLDGAPIDSPETLLEVLA